MAAEALASLFDRRLVIVSGKGGTGKTTIAAALAVLGAQTGRSVLVAEVASQEQIPQRIVPGHAPVGYRGRELLPGLFSIHIEPFQALAEYLGLQLHARALVDLVMSNKGFRQLLDASPGWRELITLGKVWHAAQMTRSDGRPLYDWIIVDAPATGHGLTFLDVPRVVASAVRGGPLRRHAHLVEDMIHDPEQCLLLPVALAEELPAQETAELVARARDEVGVRVDRVVVNAVAAAPWQPADGPALDQRLSALPNAPLGELPAAATLHFCASYLRERHELNAHYRDEIASRCGLPVVSLPYLQGGIRGDEELAAFAAPLVASIESAWENA